MIGQPTLPVEGTYTDAERAFIELSPPGLWPENQNSNFGQIRKVLTDIIQDCINEIDHLGEEMFVSTSVEYLNLWENIARVPIAPAGMADAERRARIMPRLQYGPFTRARVRSIIEGYLSPTFGEALSLTPPGLSLLPGGLSLLSGVSSFTGLYRVYEDVRNYAYAVWIKNTTTPNIAALLKELERINPAGISVSIDNTKANVLDYFRTVRNKQPVGYWRMGTGGLVDVSGYGNDLTTNGAAAAVASPGLLDAAVADGNGAHDLDGVDDYFSVAINNELQTMQPGSFSVEAWVRPDALPGAGIFPAIAHIASFFSLRINDSAEGRELAFFVGTGEPRAEGAIAVVAGTTYHVVGTYDGDKIRLYVNGVLVDTEIHAPPSAAPAGTFWIGRGIDYWNGVIDEVALYNSVLTQVQVLENYNTGINVQQPY